MSDAGALIEAEADAIAHMNADHAEACRLYATRLLGAPDGDWRCVGIDPEGIELQHGHVALRLAVSAARQRTGAAARSIETACGSGAGPLMQCTMRGCAWHLRLAFKSPLTMFARVEARGYTNV